MSAELHEPGRVAEAAIQCEPCGLPFDPASSQAEGEHLAAVHNDLHHGGRTEASAFAAADGVAAQLGWAIDPAVLEDARTQAVPFTGDKTASDRAWAARVDAAVQGMDVLDPGGFDVWARSHAESRRPHLAEAELVSAWETWVRHEFDSAPDASHADPGRDAGDDAELSL